MDVKVSVRCSPRWSTRKFQMFSDFILNVILAQMSSAHTHTLSLDLLSSHDTMRGLYS